MIDVIAQHVQKAIEAATPWLVGATMGLFALWLVMICCKAKPFAKELKWFFSLTPLHKLIVVCAFCLFAFWGGSKERGAIPPGLIGNISATMTRVGETVQPRFLPLDISTNALSVIRSSTDCLMQL